MFIYGFIKGHVRECSIYIGIHFGNEFHLVEIGGNLGHLSFFLRKGTLSCLWFLKIQKMYIYMFVHYNGEASAAWPASKNFWHNFQKAFYRLQFAWLLFLSLSFCALQFAAEAPSQYPVWILGPILFLHTFSQLQISISTLFVFLKNTNKLGTTLDFVHYIESEKIK